MADIFYFLDCRPGSIEQNNWKSAVMRYASANLKTLNSGNQPTNNDRFTYVTSGSARRWEGYMYDVSFDSRDTKATHFRCMIDPKARTFSENKQVGWAARVEDLDERSQLIPIYRGDGGVLVNMDGYDCLRAYYCTLVDGVPKEGDTWKDRNQTPTQTPPKVGCCRSQHRGGSNPASGFAGPMGLEQNQSGPDTSGGPSPLVQEAVANAEKEAKEFEDYWAKIPAEVEAPTQMVDFEFIDPPAANANATTEPPLPEGQQDFDAWSGEASAEDNNLFDDKELPSVQ